MLIQVEVSGLLPPSVETQLRQLETEGVPQVPTSVIEGLRQQANALNILNASSVLDAELSRRPTDEASTQSVRDLLNTVRAIDAAVAQPLRHNITRLVRFTCRFHMQILLYEG